MLLKRQPLSLQMEPAGTIILFKLISGARLEVPGNRPRAIMGLGTLCPNWTISWLTSMVRIYILQDIPGLHHGKVDGLVLTHNLWIVDPSAYLHSHSAYSHTITYSHTHTQTHTHTHTQTHTHTHISVYSIGYKIYIYKIISLSFQWNIYHHTNIATHLSPSFLPCFFFHSNFF